MALHRGLPPGPQERWLERDVTADARRLDASAVRVQLDFHDARAGNYSAYLQVRNEYGNSTRSSIHRFALDGEPLWSWKSVDCSAYGDVLLFTFIEGFFVRF
jgi:hypothetical protein